MRKRRVFSIFNHYIYPVQARANYFASASEKFSPYSGLGNFEEPLQTWLEDNNSFGD